LRPTAAGVIFPKNGGLVGQPAQVRSSNRAHLVVIECRRGLREGSRSGAEAFGCAVLRIGHKQIVGYRNAAAQSSAGGLALPILTWICFQFELGLAFQFALPPGEAGAR